MGEIIERINAEKTYKRNSEINYFEYMIELLEKIEINTKK